MTKNIEESQNFPIGYRCPKCGNEISLEESEYGEATLCCRCPDEEYTQMEAIYDNETF